MNFGKTLEKLREINNLYAKIYSDRDRSINKIQQDQEQNQKKVESQVKNLLEIYQDGQAKLYLEQIIQNIKKKQGFLAQDVPPHYFLF